MHFSDESHAAEQLASLSALMSHVTEPVKAAVALEYSPHMLFAARWNVSPGTYRLSPVSVHAGAHSYSEMLWGSSAEAAEDAARPPTGVASAARVTMVEGDGLRPARLLTTITRRGVAQACGSTS
eukprot:5212683-Prymnesium_polylepis.2